MPKLFRRPGSPKHQAELYCLDPDTGQRQRVCRSTGITDDGSAASERLAYEVACQQERRLSLPGGTRAPSKKLKQAIASLIAEQELAERSADTLEYTTERGNALVRGLGKDTRLDEITKERLIEYCTERRKTVAASTVLMELKVLNQACGAVGEPRKPIPDLGPDAKRSKPQRPLSVQEQRRLLMAMTPRLRLTLLAYLQMGGRYSELRKIVDIDWERRLFYIQATKRAKDRLRPRITPIPPELYAEMLPHRDSWTGFYVPSNWGMNRAIKRAAKRAGLTSPNDYHCNDLRGSYATQMAIAGADPLTLSSMMGNSPKQLVEVYAQVQTDLDHIAAQGARMPRLRGAECDNSASAPTDATADTNATALVRLAK